MQLQRVTYELFDFELPDFDDASLTHPLDGQFHLAFADAPDLYVSWVWHPVQYCVGYGPKSHLQTDAVMHRIDMTASALWAPLIGHALLLEFLDSDHQQLRLTANRRDVFVSSFDLRRGYWEIDSLTISSSIAIRPG